MGRTRVEVDLPVELAGGSGASAARASDISAGGCYIESAHPARIKSRIVFRLMLPSGRWLMLTGEVTHSRDGSGFGVRFIGMADTAQQAVAHFLEYQRGALK